MKYKTAVRRAKRLGHVVVMDGARDCRTMPYKEYLHDKRIHPFQVAFQSGKDPALYRECAEAWADEHSHWRQNGTQNIAQHHR